MYLKTVKRHKEGYLATYAGMSKKAVKVKFRLRSKGILYIPDIIDINNLGKTGGELVN
jgi:hypothetical protein